MSLDRDKYDSMFSGIIGRDYDLLKQICPLMTEMSRLVGVAVNGYPASTIPLKVVELGGGTGITTLSLLSSKTDLTVFSIDNEPTMQNQAKKHLQPWVDEGRLAFCTDDALAALKKLATGSADIVASAYTLHNFINSYRQDVILEIFRVLKPGGRFINGDRYTLDDISNHTRHIKEEISAYFKVLIQADKPDLLEQWIVHLFNDESENHIMRESVALQQLHKAGFTAVNLTDRLSVNALVSATKPL